MRPVFILVIVATLAAPLAVSAFPFGGRITTYHVCYNETLFARLSPPVPGDYVWTRSTKTYQFGPPRAVGQWLLGLTSIPYDCLWSVNPIYVQPAIAIMMMGSSGPAAPATPGGAWGPGPGAPTGGGDSTPPSQTVPTPPLVPPGTGTPPGTLSHLVISEVYYDVASARGISPDNQWVEIYNGTGASVNLSGWSIQNAGGSDALPSGTTLASGRYLLVTSATSTKDKWPLSATTTVVVLGSPIGNGLADAGDFVRLRNQSGSTVDAVSWGTNTVGFSPPVQAIVQGSSIARNPVTQDTDTRSDWVARSAPTPGR